MFESLLLGAMLAASTHSGSRAGASAPIVQVDEQGQAEAAAAAVDTAFRYEPFSGRLVSEERGDAGEWRRAPLTGAPSVARRRFELEWDAAAARLVWRTPGGARTEEQSLDRVPGLDGPNLLRLEVANFDPRATATIERLTLELGGSRRELRRLGGQAMSRDLVTVSAPELASGFRLSGEIAVHGVPEAASRVFIDLGIGSGRRVDTGRRGPVIEATHVLSNTTLIDVPSGQPGLTSGPASPYPSGIVVGGPVTGPLGGSVLDVNVKINDMFHGFTDDIDALVVSPKGTAVLLMSDACGNSASNGIDRTFDDEAANSLSDNSDVPCSDSTIQPSNYGSGDTFNVPAPASGYQSALSAFDGENANGTWSLYVMDDADGQSGSFGGWELTLNLNGYSVLIPGTGDSGTATPYPVQKVVSATGHTLFGSIIDVNVTIEGLWHQFPDDIDLLLVGPGGEAVMLMSDACGSAEIENAVWTFDDEAAAPLSDDAGPGCASGSVKPIDYGVAENLPAPAPAGPYAAALSVFDGSDPAGTWSWYLRDDGGLDVGFIRVSPIPGLSIQTTGVFRDDFESNTLCFWSDQVPPVVCG